MITIIDYGSGNITALSNIYKRLDTEVAFAKTPLDIERAKKIILPGVGAFDYALTCLENTGIKDALNEAVLERRIPILGICVGMQIMARRSEEGELDGLGWIDGEVKRFDTSRFAQRTHVPHMGWNDVVPAKPGGLFSDLEASATFYFLHSYYFSCSDDRNVLALTDYGGSFASAVRRDNITGVQFHPEKSHEWGITLLKNFAEF